MFHELHDTETTASGENALGFLLRTNPVGSLLPPRPGAAPRKLEIVAFVAEEVLEVRQVDGGCAIELGCDSVDPTAPRLIRTSARPGRGDLPRLHRDPRGWVFVPSFDMVAFVDTEGDELGPVRTNVTGETVLDGGARLLVEVGPVIYVVQEVDPSRRVPGEPVGIDTPMLSLLGFLGVSASLFGYALGTVPPPPESSTMDGTRPAVILELMRTVPPPPLVQKVKTAATGAPKGPEGAAQKGHTKPRGAPSDKDVATRVLKGLGAVLASIGDSSLPGSVTNGVTGLQGRATSLNGPGFNARSDGFGGGGVTESVGLTTRSGHGGEFVPHDGRVHEDGAVKTVSGVILLGSLDRAEVDRVIKQNMASIRYCYQKELQVHPGLSGKIAVKFTIAADGSVSSATTRPSSPMPAVESCLTARFLRMKFPEPKGGGMALVTYPFLFSE